MESKNKSHHHNGHRDRMRARFLESGPGGFADHELIEMLLYYAIPRRDTNETAHELMEECGSLAAVLESPIEKLCRVPYVKENVAIYIKLLAELSKRYTSQKLSPKKDPCNTVYDTAESIMELLFSRFVGLKKEVVYAMLFDAGMHLKDMFCVGEGSVNSVTVTVRAITERAYQRGAASVVLAHNHPDGMAKPSADDIRMTRDINAALGLMGIQLIEHFVFSENQYYPILSHDMCGGADRFAVIKAAQQHHFKK